MRSNLPKLLDFIVQKSSVSPRVKWIVSSRNWPDIVERLESAGHKVRLCLELNAESVSTAVSIYIQHKVLQLADKKKYDDRASIAGRREAAPEMPVVQMGLGICHRRNGRASAAGKWRSPPARPAGYLGANAI